MSRSTWRERAPLPPDVNHNNACPIPGGMGWVTRSVGIKRRHSHDAQEDSGKRVKTNGEEGYLATSPLLRLPAELRIRIFEFVLSGQTIHVEQLAWGSVDHYERAGIKFKRGLWNEICHCQESEQDSYTSFHKASMFAPSVVTPFGATKDGRDIGTGYHVESWSARHSACGQEPQLTHFNANLERWLSRTRLSLSPLRVCKLIYRECRRLPYTRNTFLFRNPVAFQAFTTNIRPEYLEAIQYLSLPIAVGSAPYSEARSRTWASTLWYYNLTNRLKNLKELRVTLELYFPRDDFVPIINDGYVKPTAEDCIEEICLSGETFVNQSTNWLEQFSQLRPSSACSQPESSSSLTPSSQLQSVSAPPQQPRPSYSSETMSSPKSPLFRVLLADDPLSMWGPIGRKEYCRDRRIRDVNIWMREREAKCLTVEQKQRLALELEEKLKSSSLERRAGRGAQGEGGGVMEIFGKVLMASL